MIDNLTKEEVAKLPLEIQDAVARVALDEARLRRNLIAKAKGYRRYMIVPFLISIFISLFLFWKKDVAGLPIALGFLFFVQFHMLGVNSRFDAILTLLKVDDAADKAKRFQ